MQKIYIKKLNEDFVMPQKATKGSSGYDLFSCVDILLNPSERAIIPCGFSLEMPENFEAKIRSRSGLAIKSGICVLNAEGTIDSDYRGEIGVILMNHSKEPFQINKKMKVAQMVFQELPLIDLEEKEELSATIRGEGGYGSTGI